MHILDRIPSAKRSPFQSIFLAVLVALSVFTAAGCGNNAPQPPPTAPLAPGVSGAPGPSASHSTPGGAHTDGMPGASATPK